MNLDYLPACTSSSCILQVCKVSSVSVYLLESVALTRKMDRPADSDSLKITLILNVLVPVDLQLDKTTHYANFNLYP